MDRSPPATHRGFRVRHWLRVGGAASLAAALLGGLLLVPDGWTYWRCVARHAWRRVTLRDTRFPWRQRVERSVERWQRDVFPQISDPGNRVAALQAAAEVLRKPYLAADGADPVFPLLDQGNLRGGPANQRANLHGQIRAWLDEVRRLAPDDPIVRWQEIGAPVNANTDYRSLLEEASRLDSDNAFWFYLLATLPAGGELFSQAPVPASDDSSGQGAARNAAAASQNTMAQMNQLATNRMAMRDAFQQAGLAKLAGLGTFVLISSWPQISLRDPAAFARDADRAVRCATYRHPQEELNARIASGTRSLGLPRWARARLDEELANGLPRGREFSQRYVRYAYQATSLYWDAELMMLRDALALGDSEAAQASYRRLLGVFRHLWEAYPATERREAAVFELLVPCLALLKQPAVQQTGCFPADFVQQVTQEHRRFVDVLRGNGGPGTHISANVTAPLSLTGPFPPPAVRGWLILCDSLSRAGLALAMVAGLLWAVARWVQRKRRRVLVDEGAGRARWVAWAAPCLLLVVLTGLEGLLVLAGKYAATATPSHGAEQFLYIGWSLLWCTIAAVAATFRRHRDAALPRNVGVLVFVAVLLGCYFATHLFGFSLRSGDVMIPWSNVTHVVLDPTRGRTFYEVLDGREIELLLSPVALAATVVALHGLLQHWRRRGRVAADGQNGAAGGEADGRSESREQGLSLDIRRIRRMAGVEHGDVVEHRSEIVDARQPALSPPRTEANVGEPDWRRRTIAAAGVSLVLWSVVLAVLALGVWVRLAATETEEETLRTMRDATGAPPRRNIDIAALLGNAPVDLSLRLRSGWGFWQFATGSLLLAVLLFAVSTAPDPTGARLPWAARLSLWTPTRSAALGRCVVATLGWLTLLGATLHVLGFLGASYWIQRSL